VLALFVAILLLVLILRGFVALLKGMIALWSMHMAGLKILVIELGRTFALILLVMFVVVAATVAVVTTPQGVPIPMVHLLHPRPWLSSEYRYLV
jgi:hypothetical protein